MVRAGLLMAGFLMLALTWDSEGQESADGEALVVGVPSGNTIDVQFADGSTIRFA